MMDRGENHRKIDTKVEEIRKLRAGLPPLPEQLRRPRQVEGILNDLELQLLGGALVATAFGQELVTEKNETVARKKGKECIAGIRRRADELEALVPPNK